MEVQAEPEAYQCIGEEVSVQHDFTPGTFRKVRTVRRKYVRKGVQDAKPVIAPLPPKLQDGCIAAPGLLASRISVFVETNSFRPELPQYNRSMQTTLLSPTNQTSELIATGLELLRKIYRPGYQYKKTGAMVTELVDESSVQMSLFENDDGRHRKALQAAVDVLNKRLGRNAVRFGSMGVQEEWKMRQDRKSRCFTTRWDDLLVAGA